MQNLHSPFPAGITASQTINCLLIDDDADEADIFRLALRRTGLLANLSSTTKPTEALKMLQESPKAPDIIFLDLNMPQISGKECLKRIGKIPALKAVPVVIYSTSTDLFEIKDTKRLGASHYLSKIPAIGELSEILKHLFYRKDLPYWLNLTLDNHEL